MLAVGVFMVIASGYLIYRGIREGDYMLSITGGSFFGILACVAFGTLPRAKQTAPFRYLNGEVMSKAERPVLDTWVHLAPTRPLRVTAVIAFAWVSAATAVVALIGLAQITPMPPSQTSCLPRSFLR